MSVIVAIKENGVVYMGADSQTSVGSRKITHLNEKFHKITKFKNGILVGFCGTVASKQNILAMNGLFTLNSDGVLTKEHIVTQIIPKLVNEMGQIGDEKSGEIDVSMIIAHKDSLFKITSDLVVIKINGYTKSGAGGGFVDYSMRNTQKTVRERILGALVCSARRCESVSGPYVLVNSRDKQFEIVDLGGENY